MTSENRLHLERQNVIICTWPNLQMLILNLSGPLCSIRAKEVFLDAEVRAKPFKRVILDDSIQMTNSPQRIDTRKFKPFI